MDKSLLKSSNIPGRFLDLVSRKSDSCNGAHAFVYGPVLPVSIRVGFQSVEASVLADRFVHAWVLAWGGYFCNGDLRCSRKACLVSRSREHQTQLAQTEIPVDNREAQLA